MQPRECSGLSGLLVAKLQPIDIKRGCPLYGSTRGLRHSSQPDTDVRSAHKCNIKAVLLVLVYAGAVLGADV